MCVTKQNLNSWMAQKQTNLFIRKLVVFHCLKKWKSQDLLGMQPYSGWSLRFIDEYRGFWKFQDDAGWSWRFLDESRGFCMILDDAGWLQRFWNESRGFWRFLDDVGWFWRFSVVWIWIFFCNSFSGIPFWICNPRSIL